MAKRATSVSAKRTAKRLRSGPTFIQRSRAESSEQKAIWHNVTGAGRSRVIREFFGTNPEREQKLQELAERILREQTEPFR